MILTFPTLDALRLTLESGAIPADVVNAPARAAIDAAGQIVVESAHAGDESTLADMRHLGMRIDANCHTPLDLSVTCLPQLLPLVRDRGNNLPLENAPILFELADGQRLPDLVNEMLRLGNNRQSFRWLDTDGALLRVVGPPYFSLLRALDADGARGVIAYREQAPRIWVQAGWAHPLAEQIPVPVGKILLMRQPRHWRLLDDESFRDVNGTRDFALPAEHNAWREAEPRERIAVSVRLAASGTTEAAELWVLNDGGLQQLDELVRGSDDQLLARLAFAVVNKDGRPLVVVRVRPSKQAPPVLVLQSISYRPYLRLPNLFLPCGRRLHPPLRRDAVARLLAGDAQQITWLHPEADGTFTPERVPDAAFRPLSEWIDYVLEHEREPLTPWVQTRLFAFEPFAGPADRPASKRPAPKERPPAEKAPPFKPSAEANEKTRSGKKRVKPLDALETIEPGQLQKELVELETQFVALNTPLDSPGRQALWPRLAELNAVLEHPDDAAICAGNALWESDDAVAGEWLSRCRNEQDLSTLLRADDLNPADIRNLVLVLVDLAQGNARDVDVASSLGRLHQQLEKHEHMLGVRLAWLAWEAVHRLGHGDVLVLARARDRLLERLYLKGLSADLDLPGFLRVSGAMGSERFRRVRDHMLQMQSIVQEWLTKGPPLPGATQVYVNLMFAYAFAQLGEATLCKSLAKEARGALPNPDQVHAWLIAAFAFRLDEALQGKRASSRLPANMLQQLEVADGLVRYKIDKLREHSRIVEPHEKIDPITRYLEKYSDDLSRELLRLFATENRAQLADGLNRLLDTKPKRRPPAPRVLVAALELAPRLGESFSLDVLYQVERTLKSVGDPKETVLLLEKCLILAAHFDQKEEVQELIGRFHDFLGGNGSELPLLNLETLLGGSFRSLRKLGLREEAGRLLEHMAKLIQQRKTAGKPGAEDADKHLRLQLQIASGWLYFGDIEPARQVFDSARAALFGASLAPILQTQLACAYVAALGQAPLDLALPRLMELFRKLTGVQDAFTTNSHFSLSRLDVVEAAILALVNDDFKISPEARRWLDEDEYLVRRRIHRTVRAAMEKAGM